MVCFAALLPPAEFHDSDCECRFRHGCATCGGRLLYGMGRSDAIPGKFFGAIEPKRRIPINSVLIGAITLIGALFIS